MWIDYIITSRDAPITGDSVYELSDGRIAQGRYGGWRNADGSCHDQAVDFDEVVAIGHSGEWDPGWWLACKAVGAEMDDHRQACRRVRE